VKSGGYRNLPLISAIKDIVHQSGDELIVPQVVADEFGRNKQRVAADAKRSLPASPPGGCRSVPQW
jgi:hypothetical protein